MKKTFFSRLTAMALPLLGMAMTMQVFTSCSQDPNKLPTGVVEDLVEELLEESGQEQSFVNIPVGTFELNDQHARAMLMKLQAAGVVNYKVDRYAWWNKTLEIHNYYQWYNSTHERIGNTYYDFEEHFVVTVSLTEEAKKYQVDSIPQPKQKEDEDMKQPDVNPDQFPENNIRLTEEWPYIPNPENPVRENKDKVTVDLSQPIEEDEDPGCETEEDYDTAQRLSLDIETSMNYEEVSQRFNQEIVYLKSSKLKVKKARFVQVYDSPNTGRRCGSAEVIVEMKDVTPAGRVLGSKYDGIRFCSPVEVVYYADKGWILQNRTLNLQPVSGLGVAASENGTVYGGDASSAINK
ncbi:MAG: hypothetical protein IJ570_01105 [Prevotella sp.]|nr:hypothetical protein [Prevotella sp.]